MTKANNAQAQWPMQLGAFALAWIPYLLVTWGISEVFEVKFWVVLAWLVGARLFFTVIEFAGSILIWRLVGKRDMTARLLSHLVANKMPRRYYSHEDYSSYLDRVKTDEATTRDVKEAARQAELMATLFEGHGIFAGLRLDSAMEAALEQYSPRAAAPASGQGQTSKPAQIFSATEEETGLPDACS